MPATSALKFLLNSLCLTMALLIPASSLLGQEAAPLEIVEARNLIEQQNYDEALTLLRDLERTQNCDRACRGECYLLTAYCRYRLGQDVPTRSDLKESIRLRPKQEIDSSWFPDSFVRLYEQIKRENLCSLEIRVRTRHSLALMSGDSLMAVYREDNVPVGPIQLFENDYGKNQRYMLNPARLNVFELELEELRDYWSFDSLHLSFRPDIAGSGSPGRKRAAVDSAGCVKIWRDCFELLPSNFDQDPLSFIVVGESDFTSKIAVRLATPEWKKLNEDLKANVNRRRLSRIMKVSSAVGCVGTAVWAIYSDSRADKRYDQYMEESDRYEISQLYRSYEDLVEQRNILMISSIVLAAVNVATFIFSAGDKEDLLEKFEREHGKTGIHLSLRQNRLGLDVELGV